MKARVVPKMWGEGMPSPSPPTHRLDVVGLHEAVWTRPDRERDGRVSGEVPFHETGTRNPPNAASPNSASALDSMKPQPLESGKMKRRPANRR